MKNGTFSPIFGKKEVKPVQFTARGFVKDVVKKADTVTVVKKTKKR